jgi:tetratricopeptide (TPR) repeat protein
MYGVWNSDPDGNRRRARIELIEFLLKKAAPERAESELMALATSLPPSVDEHLQAAQLFTQAGDNFGALGQYEEVLRLDPSNVAALAGAGNANYRAGNYVTAERYLQDAVKIDPQDASSRQLLASSQEILRASPFHSHISDAERNRRIDAAFARAEQRLTECAQQKGIDLAPSPASASSASPLAALQSRWTATKPDLKRLRSPAETALPDTIMDVVFQIEQQTATICGQPQGTDLALLLISQKREAAAQ